MIFVRRTVVHKPGREWLKYDVHRVMLMVYV